MLKEGKILVGVVVVVVVVAAAAVSEVVCALWMELERELERERRLVREGYSKERIAVASVMTHVSCF